MAWDQNIRKFAHKVLKACYKPIHWLAAKTWNLLKEVIHLVIRLLGEIVGKPLKKVLQVLVLLGLLFSIYMFFTHPAGVGAWCKNQLGKVWHWGTTLATGNHEEPTTNSRSQVSPPSHEDTKNVPGTSVGSTSTTQTASVAPKPQGLKPKAAPGTKPHVEGPGLVAPISKPEMGKGALTPQQLADEMKLAELFARSLYTLDYRNPYQNEDFIATVLSPKTGQAVVDEYYSEARIKKIQDAKQTLEFTQEGQARMTRESGGEDDYLITGTFKIQEEGNPAIDSKPLQFLVSIGRDPKGHLEVRSIVEVIQKGR